MSNGTDQLKAAFRKYVTDGVPLSDLSKPAKDAIIAGFAQLGIDISGSISNLVPYATKSVLDADHTQPDGRLGYVYRNNGSTSDALNNVYQYKASTTSWEVAAWYFSATAAVVQPLVDEANAAADTAVTTVAAYSTATQLWSKPAASSTTTGSYIQKDTGAVIVGAGFTIHEYALDGTELAARFTSTNQGAATTTIAYYDVSNAFLGQQFTAPASITKYKDQALTIPTGARKVKITHATSAPVTYLEVQKGTPNTVIPGLVDAASSFETPAQSIVAGQYANATTGAVTSLAGYSTITYDTTGNERAFRATAYVKGSVVALACYYDANREFISSEMPSSGVDLGQKENYVLTVPAAARRIIITTNATSQVKTPRIDVAIFGKGVRDLDSRVQVLEAASGSQNYYVGKTAVIFGTSIFDDASNNTLIAQVMAGLGITTYINEALAGSVVRTGVSANIAGADIYGLTGLAYTSFLKSLGHTADEKADIIANWATYQPMFAASPVAPSSLPTDGSDYSTSVIPTYSYETKLVANHLGSNRKDVYIFGEWVNDYTMASDVETLPGGHEYDRGYTRGALNTLFKLIFEDNPKAIVLIIGHYENQLRPDVATMQEALAADWQVPLARTWEGTRWSQKQITTTGYWSNGNGDINGVWVASGGPSQTITMLDAAFPGDLHPFRDTSGAAVKKLADNIIARLRVLR